MQKQLINDLNQEMMVLRKEITVTTNRVTRDAQDIAREMATIMGFLQKRNRQVERRLVELNKLVYALSRRVSLLSTATKNIGVGGWR